MFNNNITVRLINNNKELKINSNIKVNELLQYIKDKEEYIAAKVNNEITSLSYRIRVNSDVEFITALDSLGMEVYRRSLSFLLEKVVTKLFPDQCLVIGHSLGPGYYFDLEGKDLTKEDVALIEKEMHKETARDLPINREKISYMDALDHFKKNNRLDKYKLLSCLNQSKLSIYCCEDFFEAFDMPLVNRTGALKHFKLIYYPPGFIMQFPRKSSPHKVASFKEQKKIFEVYKEYRQWGKILKVNNVGALNEIISSHHLKNFIQTVEALHTRKLLAIAEELYQKSSEVRLIAIAGPSSSGKTTFSKRLAIQLMALGLKPVTISVDNYFIDRDKTPLGPDGQPDYETIDAINLDLFNSNLTDLMNGKEVKLPVYDFITGKSTIGHKKLQLDHDNIIIIEGIHCLNEKLTYVVPKGKKYKIYVSALSQMNIDNNNRIPTTDNRIIRRLVRDYRYRGHSALRTLRMWPSVRRGEERYIFPYQNDADGYFNSALDYELALLRSYTEPILMQVKPYHAEYAEAVRLLKFLNYFLMIQSKYVPSTSIIREFIGGSFFNY